MISKLQCFCPQNQNVLYLTGDILKTCLRGDRRSGNLVGKGLCGGNNLPSYFNTRYVSKGGFFQKVRWNFSRSPNLKKENIPKKLSWAWNLNFKFWRFKKTNHTFWKKATFKCELADFGVFFKISWVCQSLTFQIKTWSLKQNLATSVSKY